MGFKERAYFLKNIWESEKIAETLLYMASECLRISLRASSTSSTAPFGIMGATLRTSMLWTLTIAFSVLQTLQVVLYGYSFKRTANTWQALIDPVFLFALGLSVGTALIRLWMFPHWGVTRTHVITSVSFVLSFFVFLAVFREHLTPQHYLGTFLITVGIYLVSR